MKRALLLPLLCLTLLATSPASAGPMVSTAADRTSLALTVYGANLALVRETRRVQAAAGDLELRLTGVPAHLLPGSVQIGRGGIDVVEQRFADDLQSNAQLLQSYVGKTVKIVRDNPATGVAEQIEATLLSAANPSVFRAGDQILLDPPGRLVLPDLPEVVTEPTLIWKLAKVPSSAFTTELTYLTEQIGWRADYVVRLAADETEARLSAWATVENHSGAAYPDAQLQLVAGTVNRAPAPQPLYARSFEMKARAAATQPEMAQEPLFEYHVYSLDRPTTIGPEASVQLQLLQAQVKATKYLVLSGAEHFSRGPQPEPPPPQHAEVVVELENTSDEPLPAGTARVYRAAAGGGVEQFVGEDRLPQTPRGERVHLHLGQSFDVVGERKQTDYKVIDSSSWEVAWEIGVRNHKGEPVDVKLLEPMPAEWEVLSASHPHTRADAHTLRFEVAVAAGGETTVTYRARIRTLPPPTAPGRGR